MMNFLRLLPLPSLVRHIRVNFERNCFAKLSTSNITTPPPESHRPQTEVQETGVFNKYIPPINIDVDDDEDSDNIIETGVHRRENCDRIILRGLDDCDDDDF